MWAIQLSAPKQLKQLEKPRKRIFVSSFADFFEAKILGAKTVNSSYRSSNPCKTEPQKTHDIPKHKNTYKTIKLVLLMNMIQKRLELCSSQQTSIFIHPAFASRFCHSAFASSCGWSQLPQSILRTLNLLCFWKPPKLVTICGRRRRTINSQMVLPSMAPR